MEKFKTLQLSEKEINYLKNSESVPDQVKDMLHDSEIKNANECSLHIGINQARKLIDAISHEITVHGFDDEYELTEKGEMLEELMDRVFNRIILPLEDN